MTVASIVGVWFSVQHRFEHAHWAGNRSWDFTWVPRIIPIDIDITLKRSCALKFNRQHSVTAIGALYPLLITLDKVGFAKQISASQLWWLGAGWVHG